MRATEMHDLLADCREAILANIPTWKPGEGQFSHIQYCRYCHYAIAHAHGEGCLLMRLETATGAADNTEGSQS